MGQNADSIAGQTAPMSRQRIAITIMAEVEEFGAPAVDVIAEQVFEHLCHQEIEGVWAFDGWDVSDVSA